MMMIIKESAEDAEYLKKLNAQNVESPTSNEVSVNSSSCGSSSNVKKLPKYEQNQNLMGQGANDTIFSKSLDAQVDGTGDADAEADAGADADAGAGAGADADANDE